MIVEALTDNRNRTASEGEHLHAHGGNLGATGAVAWQFERLGGVVLVEADGVDEDDFVMAAADAGADDVELDRETLSCRGTGGARRCSRGQSRRLPARVGGAFDGAEDDVVIADESTANRRARLVEGLRIMMRPGRRRTSQIPEAMLEAVAGPGRVLDFSRTPSARGTRRRQASDPAAAPESGSRRALSPPRCAAPSGSAAAPPADDAPRRPARHDRECRCAASTRPRPLDEECP